MSISIERNVTPQRLTELGIAQWPTWGKGCSSFPWHYDMEETSYIVRGEVVVTPEGGEPVEIQAGDLVTFAAGLTCRWEIRVELLKHYRL